MVLLFCKEFILADCLYNPEIVHASPRPLSSGGKELSQTWWYSCFAGSSFWQIVHRKLSLAWWCCCFAISSFWQIVHTLVSQTWCHCCFAISPVWQIVHRIFFSDLIGLFCLANRSLWQIICSWKKVFETWWNCSFTNWSFWQIIVCRNISDLIVLLLCK